MELPSGEHVVADDAVTLRRRDNTYAWLIALSPLVFVLLGVIVAVGGTGTLPYVIALAVVTVVAVIVGAIADHRRVRASGARVPLALAVLLVPVYLFVRSARTKSTYAIPATWLGATVVTLASALVIPVALGVPLNVGWVESQTEASIATKTGVDVTLTCPDSLSVRVGETFQCQATTGDDDSSAVVDLKLQNVRGDVIWKLDGSLAAMLAQGAH